MHPKGNAARFVLRGDALHLDRMRSRPPPWKESRYLPRRCRAAPRPSHAREKVSCSHASTCLQAHSNLRAPFGGPTTSGAHNHNKPKQMCRWQLRVCSFTGAFNATATLPYRSSWPVPNLLKLRWICLNLRGGSRPT